MSWFNSATLWTGAHQAPPTIGFPRQEYWSGLPFPSPGDLPNSGIKPRSPTLQADSLLLIHQESPRYQPRAITTESLHTTGRPNTTKKIFFLKSNVLCMNSQESMEKIFALLQGFSTSELLTFGAGKFFTVEEGLSCALQDLQHHLQPLLTRLQEHCPKPFLEPKTTLSVAKHPLRDNVTFS